MLLAGLQSTQESEHKYIPPHGEVHFCVHCSTLGQRNLWPEEFSQTPYHLLKH